MSFFPKTYILPCKTKTQRLYLAHVASEIKTAERRERTGGWGEYHMLSLFLYFPRLSVKTTAGTGYSSS